MVLNIPPHFVQDKDIPKYDLEVRFGDIGFRLTDAQFRDLKSLTDWIALLEKVRQLLRFMIQLKLVLEG